MKNFLILSLLLAFLTTEVCAQWKPAGDKIKTQWANKINTSAVLPEYPRPIMERNEWKNLNGLWEYAITDLGGNVPAHFDGQILVPFAVESSLSGVGQRVGAKKELWYSRSFEVPVAWKNKNVLLHFGAVDWKADIWVNDVKVGSHTGGFTPFSFDITAALSGKGNNKLVVKVWDPTDEALVYDIQKTKYLGFNMIRKHIKVEPARWYTHCDQLGIIVWQDMPSGDRNPEWQNRKYFEGTEKKRSAVSEACYRKEWKEIMDCLYSYPCIGTWVPFNEAWGQFKTPEIAEWTKEYDPTRLVNPASGGNHYTCGDMLDLHNYPAPEMYLYDAQRANVLGEYGGIGWVVKNHIWEPDRNWGYIQFNSSKEVTDEYIKYTDMLYDLIIRGFSAAVYTQTTDVEVEVNGLMTYDRKVIKVDEKRVREANARICKSLK